MKTETIRNVRATETGPATASSLKAIGFDVIVYMGEVSTKRTVREAMLYRNEATGEYVVIASALV